MEPIPSLLEFDELYKENLELKKQLNQLKIENSQLNTDKAHMKKNLEKARLIIVEQRKKIISQQPQLDNNGNLISNNVTLPVSTTQTPLSTPLYFSTSSSVISSPSFNNNNSSNNSYNNNNKNNINKSNESIINIDSLDSKKDKNKKDESIKKDSYCDIEMGQSPVVSSKGSPMIKSFSLPSIYIPFFSKPNSTRVEYIEEEIKENNNYNLSNPNNSSLSDKKQFTPTTSTISSEILISDSSSIGGFEEFSSTSTPTSGISSPNKLNRSSGEVNTNFGVNGNGNSKILMETIKNMIKKNKEATKQQDSIIKGLQREQETLKEVNSFYKDKIESLEKILIKNQQQQQLQQQQKNNINGQFLNSPSKLLNNIRLSPIETSLNNPSNNRNNSEVQLEVIVL
ncbi:hypothetical protein DICPUDRAFT_79098 [Dictyostelium purpureum]|uniref:Uncharacterized protein n=1 Tax=Dictyostelium purpureum TaxID=5786 RepID=F0ZLK0_DICPU|nr:uncharacterized protein DICPUDRAFT_79098 [Dictyostelium purpureum]EGC35206.1 hypothetical protein DICPUDRAFT_79098 [Dictyostelium purpureum]|eukprot:XP_003288294.1 hypothetical protein DICPUDRAFT_79098 [Dictyostelium purpureum]